MLLAYGDSLPPDVYRQVLPVFGAASIRDLHVHAAQCYLDHLPPGGPVVEPDGADAAATRRLFAKVDAVVAAFLTRHAEALDEPLTFARPGRPQPRVRTPRWLLTHAVTHEFHHKGQIVKLGRLLGYPVALDTDLAAPADAGGHGAASPRFPAARGDLAGVGQPSGQAVDAARGPAGQRPSVTDTAGDLARLAKLTGQSVDVAAAEAVAAALARAVAPEVDAAAIAERTSSPAVERPGLRLAAEAAREIESYPLAMQPAIAAAGAAIAGAPGDGRYGFRALGADWRVLYLAEERPPRVLALTTRERAGR